MATTNFSGPVVSTNGFKTGSTTLTGADFANIQALVSGGGNLNGGRTVLFCDSMTDWYNFGSGAYNPTSAIYSSATGYLTITLGGIHQLHDGVMARIWHYSYDSMRDHVYVPLEWVSTTVVRAQMGPLAGVPDATDIKTGLFYYLDNERAAASFVNWIQMVSGWPLTIVRNAAQSGDVSAGGLRRVARDIAAYRPALVIGQMLGINDLNASSGVGVPENTVIANNEALFDAIIESGACLVVGTMTPVSSTETARAKRSNMQYVLRLNDWLREYASRKRGVFVVDHYKHFIDIANADGLALAARVRNDGIHWATKTCRLAVRDWLPIIQRLAPVSDSTLPKSILDCHANSRITVSSASAAGGVVTVNATGSFYRPGDEFRALGGSQALANGWFSVATAPNGNSFTYLAPGIPDGAITGLLISRSRNLFVNPLLQTTTGGLAPGAGVTGVATCPLGLSTGAGVGAITATASIGAAANVGSTALGFALPVVGNEFSLAVTQADAAARPQFAASGTGAFATQILQGRSYIFECVLKLQSTNWALTPIRSLFVQLAFTVDGSVYTRALSTASQDTSETSAFAEDMRLHLRTPVIKSNVGTAVTAADFLVAATSELAFSAGPTLTMGISQINVLDVTGREDLYI